MLRLFVFSCICRKKRILISEDNSHLEFSASYFTFKKRNLHYFYTYTVILRTVNGMNNKLIIVLLFYR